MLAPARRPARRRGAVAEAVGEPGHGRPLNGQAAAAGLEAAAAAAAVPGPDDGNGVDVDPGYDYSAKGVIEEVDGWFKVTFVREAETHVLGLFKDMEEGYRVCDVATIKECVDAGMDVHKLELHFELEKYGVTDALREDIKGVAFHQVMRDLQVCAALPIHGSPALSSPLSRFARLGA